MAVIDMPLEELKVYTGTNPCPSDINRYWDAGIAEVKSIEPKVKLIERDRTFGFVSKL